MVLTTQLDLDLAVASVQEQDQRDLALAAHLEALLDAAGGCRDGLHRQGVSLNQGAESTVLALEATLDVTLMQRALIPPLPAERTPVTAGRA